jgi:flagellin
MALAIATNNAALNAAASASSVNRDMETSMARLSSGKRINSASDDAAGVAISSRLSAEIRGTDQAIRNALDGQALIDTAEGAHSEIENILQRMREVAVQAANDTNNAQDRMNLQAEIDALVTEINRIASTTTWAGEKLMEDPLGTDFSFQVGAKTSGPNQIGITINGMGASKLGLKDIEQQPFTVDNAVSGSSFNTVTYDGTTGNQPALNGLQGKITFASGIGLVTANNNNTELTLEGLGKDLADVTYTAGDSVSINAAAAAINAGTAETNVYATVTDNGAHIELNHITGGTHTTATGIGTFTATTLANYTTANDTKNSDSKASIDVSTGVITFDPSLSRAAASTDEVTLNLALKDSDGTVQNAIVVKLKEDLSVAVTNINAKTAEHGYIASITAVTMPDGSIDGKLKLVAASAGAGSGFTQLGFVDIDKMSGRVPHATQQVEQQDGHFHAIDGSPEAVEFKLNETNTSGSVNLTLGATNVTVEGISTKGAEQQQDAGAVVTAIMDGYNKGLHGYKAEIMQDNSSGSAVYSVKIIEPPMVLGNLAVTSATDTVDTITAIDEAIKTVNIQRSSLGAVSNRLSHTINNLTNISTNLSAAQGGIEDADFAHETTMLAKNQILQQASTAMLAQANASKQNVLSLLQG